jgi:hypothetical protein
VMNKKKKGQQEEEETGRLFKSFRERDKES